MDYLTVILIGISLSVDAFTVSVCDGLTMDLNKRRRIFIAAVFGIFQGVMPLIGYFIGSAFISKIKPYDVWLAFALLVLVGGEMIIEAIRDMRSGEQKIKPFKYGTVLLQGVATSIDALAVGITLNMLAVPVYASAAIIASITFGLCLIAVFLGEKINKLFKGKTEISSIIGGAVLLMIAVKLVLDYYVFA